jgi:hypothetical protein
LYSMYSISPRSRKRFMKKLTGGRVVPTISARASCVMGAPSDSVYGIIEFGQDH